MDQPGKVANPARCQLSRENENLPVPVRTWEFGLARRVRPFRPAPACSWCVKTYCCTAVETNIKTSIFIVEKAGKF